jgi:hypothetical protein
LLTLPCPEATSKLNNVTHFTKIITMNPILRGVLGTTGTAMLLHAGYSAFESLTYEKTIDPSSPLDIPLDVRRAELLVADTVCRSNSRQ